MDKWTRHGLPASIDGLSLVDVGCWEGEICVEALKRGGSPVVGIDYCTSPDLHGNLETHPFAFIQMDLLSEKALQLPQFDIVHSAGVLYHVENPLSFLFRLRNLCKPDGLLFLETTVASGPADPPVMVFHPGASFDDNPSNWWTPTESCLIEMLKEVGLVDLEVSFKDGAAAGSPPFSIGRIGVKGRAVNSPNQISQKLLPRRPSYMPSAIGGGNRRGVER
jgi:SAM-dependent methyltransferase